MRRGRTLTKFKPYTLPSVMIPCPALIMVAPLPRTGTALRPQSSLLLLTLVHLVHMAVHAHGVGQPRRCSSSVDPQDVCKMGTPELCRCPAEGGRYERDYYAAMRCSS
ncbi:hypothetical protein AcW2_007262 [Taiwanofungus camphoratus]|nr:hypothetical protein AcW2_007262 [Antrodia cinnamomea]